MCYNWLELSFLMSLFSRHYDFPHGNYQYDLAHIISLSYIVAQQHHIRYGFLSSLVCHVGKARCVVRRRSHGKANSRKRQASSVKQVATSRTDVTGNSAAGALQITIGKSNGVDSKGNSRVGRLIPPSNQTRLGKIPSTTSSTRQLAFLSSQLSFLDARRSAIDIRATVVLAASSLALGLVFSQLKSGELLYPGPCVFDKGWSTFVSQVRPSQLLFPGSCVVNRVMVGSILVSLMVACILSLVLIAPIARPRRIRRVETKSLSWFYLIASMTPAEYHQEIVALTDADILVEQATQTVKVSRLVKERYRRLKWACRSLYSAIVLLIVYSVVMLLRLK